MTRIEGGDERHVDVEVVMVVTDSRLRFVSGAAGAEAGSLKYADVASVALTLRDGGEQDRAVEITSVDEVRWEFPLPEVTETVEATLRHLAWIGEVRRRLVEIRARVERAADEMAALAEAKDWEGAEEVYEETRRAVDRVSDAVFATHPIAAHNLAPELTDIERELENGYVALHVDRSSAHLTLCQHLIENEDFGQARNVLARAKAQHRSARQHVESLQRGDAFKFGEQRELDQDLDRLGWQIDAVSAEPIRQAHEEKILANGAEDPTEELEHWERALARYVRVLALEADHDEQQFAGDREEVNEEMATAADRLVSLHRLLARSRWDQAVTHHDDGAIDTAIEHYTAAQDHLSRAHDLADQFDPETATTLREELEKIVTSLMRVRESAAQPGGDEDDGPLPGGDPGEGAKYDPPPDDVSGAAGDAASPEALESRRASRPGGSTDGYSPIGLGKIDTDAEISLK
ncbi:MAG: hypothetical protein V5A24_00250 [Haloarculaceae archaeon]